MLQALGQQDEASQMLSRALHQVDNIQKKHEDAPDVAARCQGLLAFLESRRNQQ